MNRTDFTVTKRIQENTRNNCVSNKLDSLDKTDKFFESHKLPKLSQEKI